MLVQEEFFKICDLLNVNAATIASHLTILIEDKDLITKDSNERKKLKTDLLKFIEFIISKKTA